MEEGLGKEQAWRGRNKNKGKGRGSPIFRITSRTLTRKNRSTLMFIAALFKITKIWKQPQCPSVDDKIKELCHLHNRILLSHKKEENFTHYDSIDGPGEHYAK